MIAALFEVSISPTMSNRYLFQGEDVHAVLSKFNERENLECFTRMRHLFADGEEGDKQCEKLSEFVDKWQDDELTLQELSELDIHFYSTAIRCLAVAEGEEAIAALAAREGIAAK